MSTVNLEELNLQVDAMTHWMRGKLQYWIVAHPKKRWAMAVNNDATNYDTVLLVWTSHKQAVAHANRIEVDGAVAVRMTYKKLRQYCEKQGIPKVFVDVALSIIPNLEIAQAD